MKKYSFVILDDENQHTTSGGWKRVFDLFLIPKNYVIEDSNYISLSETSTYIQNTGPLEVQFFKPENYSYSEIYNRMSSEEYQAQKDVFFIDMNWNNADSIKNSNIEERNLEDISFNDIAKGKIPSVLAGLYLLNILTKNNRPKIVFSGSDKTENIIKVFKLLSNLVLTDDILIGEMTGGGNNNYIDEVEKKVDSYLQSCQINIIKRQTADKIEELNDIVNKWNGKVFGADNLRIPNNGIDTNSEYCWSLRTLFPKHVNRIELGINVNENKKVIIEVLNNLNFRQLYKWLVGEHGGIDGNDIRTLLSDNNGKQLVYNRIKVINNIESEPNLKVSDKSRQYYVLFNEIIKNKTLNELVEILTGGMQDIREEIGKKFNGINNVDIEYTLCGKSYRVNFSHKGLIKTLAINFGVYIGDLYYLYNCIKGNNKHNLIYSILIENYFPILKVDVLCDTEKNIQILVITVNVNSGSECYEKINNINQTNEIKSSIDKKLTAYPFEIELKEQSIEDYVCLFSNRYNAKIEMQFGKKCLTVNSDRSTIIEEKINDKIEFVFTILTI